MSGNHSATKRVFNKWFEEMLCELVAGDNRIFGGADISVASEYARQSLINAGVFRDETSPSDFFDDLPFEAIGEEDEDVFEDRGYSDEDAPPETNTYGNNEEENENDTNWTPGGMGNERRTGDFQKGNGGFLEFARKRREAAERAIRRLQSEGAGKVLEESEYSDEIKQGIAAAEALGASDIFVIDGTIRIMVNLPDDPSFFL